MRRETLTLVNKLGLHARAAASFVKTAAAFPCDITISLNDRKVSAKSIMGVMSLGAAKGSVLELAADGPEEAQAVDALSKLVAGRFGEET
jgi:phosphocarrier protein